MIDLGGKRIVDTATRQYNYALMGRPTTCPPELAQEIFELIANGRTATSACKEKGINYSALNRACHKNGELSEGYARAQESFNFVLGYATIDIADDILLDHNHKRVMIEARREYLGAFDPSRWSKKLNLEITNKGDARQAEQKADARLLRYQSNGLLPHIIDVVGETLPRPADKQSAGLAISPPADDIFA